MRLRKDYPYDEAINDLANYVEKHIFHDAEKEEFKALLDECRKENRVPMRQINLKISEYRKKYKSYTSHSESEKEMMEDLMYFWG